MSVPIFTTGTIKCAELRSVQVSLALPTGFQDMDRSQAYKTDLSIYSAACLP
jgi:hypothetical protein